MIIDLPSFVDLKLVQIDPIGGADGIVELDRVVQHLVVVYLGWHFLLCILRSCLIDRLLSL